MKSTAAVLATWCVAAGMARGESAEKTPMRARYLVLDSRIIQATENARLTVGTVRKHPRNPLFGEDKPWEQRFDNLYASIVHDEENGLYKLW